MRKSSELTRRLQVAVSSGKSGVRRNNATPLFGIHHAKREGRVATSPPPFEPLFMTHPSEVGSTSPWTLLAAMVRGPFLSPDVSPSDYMLWGF